MKLKLFGVMICIGSGFVFIGVGGEVKPPYLHYIFIPSSNRCFIPARIPNNSVTIDWSPPHTIRRLSGHHKTGLLPSTEEEGRSSAGLKFERTGGVKNVKRGRDKKRDEICAFPFPSPSAAPRHALVTDIAAVFAAS